MRTLNEVLIGAIVFVGIDRLSKVISTSILKKGEDDVKKYMLRIELVTLFVALYIAIHFV
jgi:hypothetical protein